MQALELDLTGQKCPMPIVQLSKVVKQLDPGAEFTAVADDPAFRLDVESWCRNTGHELLRLDDSDHRFVAVIRKA